MTTSGEYRIPRFAELDQQIAAMLRKKPWSNGGSGQNRKGPALRQGNLLLGESMIRAWARRKESQSSFPEMRRENSGFTSPAVRERARQVKAEKRAQGGAL